MAQFLTETRDSSLSTYVLSNAICLNEALTGSLMICAYAIMQICTDSAHHSTVVGNGFADGHGLSGFRTSRVFRE